MPTYNSQVDRNDAAALVPEDVSREILQAIPQTSAVLQIARRLPNMPRNKRRLPILSVLPQAYFVSGDTGLKQTSEAAWANKYLAAEEIAVLVPVPNAVLDDVDYDIWGELRPHIATAFGRLIDQTILYATAAGPTYLKPSNDWPDGIVPGALAAAQIVSLAASADLYEATLSEGGTFAMVEEDGFNVTGNIAHLRMRAKLRGARDADGNPIFTRSAGGPTDYELDGTPLIFPVNGSVDDTLSLTISGDFQQLVYAMRQDMTYTISTEGVISDAAGAVVYNLFQQDMTAMRVVMRMAWQIPNPPSYIKPVYGDATRFPFAVLQA